MMTRLTRFYRLDRGYFSTALLSGVCLAFMTNGHFSEAAEPPETTPSQRTSTATPTTGTSPMSAIQKDRFGTTSDGIEISRYRLAGSNGFLVELIDLGASIIRVEAADRHGMTKNITAAFTDVAGYEQNKPYFGGICGRFANRIHRARFSIDGTEYQVTANSGGNHIHGGVKGLNKHVWKSEIVPGPLPAVRFTNVSPAGEEGFPGTLTSVVTYTVTPSNEIKIQYTVTTDAPTVLNITNHAYWNLSGNLQQTILDHLVTLHASRYVPIDAEAIPTGELAPVAGTEMDFQTPHLIGERIAQTVNGAGGYDHCYVIDGQTGTLRPAARVEHPASGRVMEVFTTEPGVQLYTGNYLTGTPETGNVVKQGAFCLEAQHLPDSPNQPKFPSTILRPGETYRQTTVHRFSVAKS